MKQILTVSNILAQKTTYHELRGEFYEAFGRPQDFGVWFAWGPSGSGKSTFIMQLTKEMAHTKKTMYNTLEEEPADDDFKKRIKRIGMADVADNFHVQQYTLDEMNEYLNKRYSPEVVIIDSAPYFFRRLDEYFEFKEQWVKRKRKTLIFTGSAKTTMPDSEMQLEIMRDAKMKIFVSGYLATCKGRTIGPNGGSYIIYKQGYEQLHGIGSSV